VVIKSQLRGRLSCGVREHIPAKLQYGSVSITTIMFEGQEILHDRYIEVAF
jgi:hypothetical protein